MSRSYYTGANLSSTAGTFAGWLDRTNEIIYDLSTVVVTAASVSVANSSNGSRTVGNADIQGYLSANNMMVWTSLTGGKNSEFGNTDTLTIASNTVIGNSTVSDSLIVWGATTLKDNVALGTTSADIVSFLGTVNTAITPSTTAARNLGTTSLNWATGYINAIRSNDFTLGTITGTETFLFANTNAEVSLYFNNIIAVSTKSGGINVIGETETDTLLVTGNANFQSSVTINDLVVNGTASLPANVSFSAGSYANLSISSLLTVLGSGIVTTDINIQDTAIFDDAGANTITLQAPTAVSASYTLSLPVNAGTSGQGLTTNGSGVTSWTTLLAAGSAGTKTAGTLSFANNVQLNMGGGTGNTEIYHTGSGLFFDSNGDFDIKFRDGNSGNADRFTFDISTGNFTATGTISGTYSGSGASLTSLNASELSSGTVPSARLTGTYANVTANNSSFLGGAAAASYLRSDAADIVTAGSITFNDNVPLYLGTGNDVDLYFNGADLYFDFAADTINVLYRDSGDNTIHNFGLNSYSYVLNSYDATAAGPLISLIHLSTSPANFDEVGQIDFDGYNSINASTVYGRIIGYSEDITSTSEDGSLQFIVRRNGTLANGISINDDAAGEVRLFHDSSLKLATKAAGVTVTGNTTTTGSFIDSNGVVGLSSSSLSANGHATMNGVTFQWGLHPITAATGTVTFPTTFSTAVFSIVFGNQHTAAAYSQISWQTANTSQFAYKCDAAIDAFSWMAIGH